MSVVRRCEFGLLRAPKCSVKPFAKSLTCAFLLIASLALPGCAQTSAPGQSHIVRGTAYAPTQAAQINGYGSEMAAAYHAEKAALEVCFRQKSQAAEAGVVGSDLLRMGRECVRRASLLVTGVRDKELASDTTIYGKTTTLSISAMRAEKAGNIQQAVDLYRSIDGNTNPIEAEAARLTQAQTASVLSPFQTAGTPLDKRDRTPQENQDIQKGQALILMLMHARREIAKLDIQLDRQVEARQYQQRSLELETAQKEYAARLDEDAKKAARAIFTNAMTTSHCYGTNYGSFGISVNCYDPSKDEDTQKLLRRFIDNLQ